jgi:hypothetical protein
VVQKVVRKTERNKRKPKETKDLKVRKNGCKAKQ